MTRFILDSGDPHEYKEAFNLFKEHNKELWGSTTNPSLIAKKLAESGKKLTQSEAFSLQKDLVSQILYLVPGAVSAEVYADRSTKAQEMIEQGREIAKWDKRVVVKLPTTIEGFKARTVLRKEGIVTNNTLVFSPLQIFAISWHEMLITAEFGPIQSEWPSFISPFVGRLDDIGENGLQLVSDGMLIKSENKIGKLWMLEASVRTPHHINAGIALGSELITAPLKVYKEWIQSENAENDVTIVPQWATTDELLENTSNDINGFIDQLESGIIDISHPLTDKGIDKFVEDWKAILST